MTQLGPNDLVFSSVPVMERPLLDRLDPVREAGFTGFSLLPSDLIALEEQGMRAEEVGQRIRDAGLVVSVCDCTPYWLPAQHATPPGNEMHEFLRGMPPERVVDLAARVGARSVAAVEMMGVTPSLDEAAEAYAHLCDLAAEHGLLTHIEFLPFGGIPNLMRAWAIVEAAGRPNGGITLDSWHLQRSGSTLEQLATIPGKYIHVVQINDAPAKAGADLFTETMNARLLPGEGEFDLVALIHTLDAIGCTAPIEIEVFNTRQADQSLQEIASDWITATRAVIANARGKG